ncbi:MAG: hypothetical protein JZU67_01280, partial [Burkholderiaceae bacterium]|nr:hypothetical protein [Burkholderiaceae bacterium]
MAGSESFFAVHHSCSSYTILAVITPGRVSYYSNLFVEGDDECPCFSVIGSNDDDTDFLPLTIMFDCMSESLLILVICWITAILLYSHHHGFFNASAENPSPSSSFPQSRPTQSLAERNHCMCRRQGATTTRRCSINSGSMQYCLLCLVQQQQLFHFVALDVSSVNLCLPLASRDFSYFSLNS